MIYQSRSSSTSFTWQVILTKPRAAEMQLKLRICPPTENLNQLLCLLALLILSSSSLEVKSLDNQSTSVNDEKDQT